MPLPIKVIKWCILNFEELYCLPGLQQNFGICWKGIVLRQAGARWDLLESHSLFGWVACFWRFPLTACFGLISKISGQHASFWAKHRGDFWMGHGWNRPAWQCLLLLSLPLQSKKSFGLGGQYIFFLLLAIKTIVSSGSTNNYFTSYSSVFVTVFIPYSEVAQPPSKE